MDQMLYTPLGDLLEKQRMSHSHKQVKQLMVPTKLEHERRVRTTYPSAKHRRCARVNDGAMYQKNPLSWSSVRGRRYVEEVGEPHVG